MSFSHHALLYRDDAEYAEGVGNFVAEGLDAGEQVMVSVPAEKHDLLRARLNGGSDRVRLEDMRSFGGNPWRIIPGVRSWVKAQGGGPVRFVGEPIWPGRSAAALEEATRHESLINLAFAGSDAAILCPYDAAALGPDALAGAEQTHPTFLSCDGHETPSDRYSGLALALASDELPAPPADGLCLPVTEDLAALRRDVRVVAEAAGLRRQRVDDLLLAVSEAATNALIHGREPRTATIWGERDHLLCEIRSHGQIADPLAGRRPPGDRLTGGRGMWLINQVCDLVELRLGPPDAVLRLHVARG